MAQNNIKSQNDIRNSVNFIASSGKSENLHLGVLLLSTVNYVWSKKITEELYVIKLKNDAQFEEKLTCPLKNGMRNLANFDSTLESLKICTLMVPFWAKYMIFELKNYKGVMCHDTEWWCNN